MWGSAARGQTTRVAGVAAPVTLPPAVYTSPGANAAAIDNFVKLNVQNLLNDTDPAGQAKARENLVLATQQAGGLASPEFLFEYGRAINNTLSPKLSGANANQLSLRQRMNMAILVAKVARDAQNATLQETTKKLLMDPTEPVVAQDRLPSKTKTLHLLPALRNQNRPSLRTNHSGLRRPAPQ